LNQTFPPIIKFTRFISVIIYLVYEVLVQNIRFFRIEFHKNSIIYWKTYELILFKTSTS
jgi:hypothetical protein